MVKVLKAYKIYWHKEVILLILALASVGLLIYEEIVHPNGNRLIWIDRFDFVVACIFLVDFIWLYCKSTNKKQFIKHNWYLLLASIPLVNTWTEALRGLRLLRFIRLLRVGEHIEYGIYQNGKKNTSRQK